MALDVNPHPCNDECVARESLNIVRFAAKKQSEVSLRLLHPPISPFGILIIRLRGKLICSFPHFSSSDLVEEVKGLQELFQEFRVPKNDRIHFRKIHIEPLRSFRERQLPTCLRMIVTKCPVRPFELAMRPVAAWFHVLVPLLHLPLELEEDLLIILAFKFGKLSFESQLSNLFFMIFNGCHTS